MNQMLQVGESVNLVNATKTSIVRNFLGAGGQGEVYRTEFSGSSFALKWYFAQQATEQQRAAVSKLILLGPPDDRFLWPLDLAVSDNAPGFGYVMPLRDARFKGIVDLLKRRIEPEFRTLAKAGHQLADSYLRLHAKGWCYRDVSWGNVFFDPGTGDVLICDNDNVAIDAGVQGNVLGTLGFMAPEVVRGDSHPSTQSDLFSLAVLLFYVFLVHHPLHGAKEASIKCLDYPAMQMLYGTNPIFIFDPHDASNKALPGFHDNAIEFWKIYPEFFKQLFMRSFTEGIRDPLHGRVRESEWRQGMVKLIDSIMYCGKCGNENFYDGEKVRAGQGLGSCWSCRAELDRPYRIRIGTHVVMLNRNTTLMEYHLDPFGEHDFSKQIGAVAQHPKDPARWGIQNVSVQKWTVSFSDGRTSDVEPGRTAPLQNGIRINFGKAEGEVRY